MQEIIGENNHIIAPQNLKCDIRIYGNNNNIIFTELYDYEYDSIGNWIKREKTFIADGKATDVTDFAEITVVPLKSNEFTEIPFTLSSEGGSLSGTLKDSGFGEFRSEIALDFVPSKVLVGEEGKQSEIALADVLAGKLGWSDAVNIARKEFADRTATESADGDKSREVYVKLITGDRKTYYYYVAFIGKGVDYWAVLLDPVDGTVISKK